VTDRKAPYEAPNVEEIDADGLPISTAAGLSGPEL